MAYPVATLVTEPGEATTSLECALPEHQEGDVVFVCVAQDGTATLTAPGSPWVVISTGTAGSGTRLVMYAVAGASPLADPVVTSNISDGFNCVATTIRDADTTSPIDAWVFGSQTASSGVSAPALTTNNADTLCLLFTVSDSAMWFRFPIDQLNVLGMSVDGAVSNLVGYRVGGAAGAAPAITGGAAIVSDTWMMTYVAVKNKAGGALPPEIKDGPVTVVDYAYTTVPTVTGLSAITPTIDGLATADCYQTPTRTLTINVDEAGGRVGSFEGNLAATTDGFVGSVHDISAIDLSGSFVAVRWAWTGTASLYGPKGWIFIIVDSVGRWAAYRLATPSEVAINSIHTIVIDPAEAAMVGSSTVPPDITNITKIGFAHHRRHPSSSLSSHTQIRNVLVLSRVKFVGGSTKDSASPYGFARLVNAARVYGLTQYQGAGQALFKVPFQLGDSNSQSIVRLDAGASTEIRRIAYDQKVGELGMGVVIDAASGDVVDLAFASFGSLDRQLFHIAPTSSPSASYNFTGTVFSGLEIEWKSGIPCNGANFFGCHQIDTDGAPFSNCSFSGSVATADLLTSNPANISNCTFTQGDAGGHAIEITQPGTYSFVGNTFSGYGLDGTTDAAIYNNSGGHVTLNVSGGGDTPTIRNGSGATTDVVSGAQITVVGLAAGSQVKVTKVSNGDVLFNGAESGGQISFSTTYIGAVRVDARKASASPFYKPWATQATTISGQTVEVTALQELDE